MKNGNGYLTADKLLARIETKYPAPSWAFFTEVKSEVGFGRRRADGLAIAMWRSLGLLIHGFEVKTYRADWLREIKDAGKSNEIFSYCDHWWVVVSDETIVREGELPAPWGMMLANGRGLKITKPAPKLDPKPLDRVFVCSVLRTHYQKRTDPRMQPGYLRGFEDGKAEHDYTAHREHEDLERLKKAIADFEAKSGVHISEWGAGNIGEAVRLVSGGAHLRVRRDIEYLRDRAKGILDSINAELEKPPRDEGETS